MYSRQFVVSIVAKKYFSNIHVIFATIDMTICREKTIITFRL